MGREGYNENVVPEACSDSSFRIWFNIVGSGCFGLRVLLATVGGNKESLTCSFQRHCLFAYDFRGGLYHCFGGAFYSHSF